MGSFLDIASICIVPLSEVAGPAGARLPPPYIYGCSPSERDNEQGDGMFGISYFGSGMRSCVVYYRILRLWLDSVFAIG
jgi:hypothetical protein